MATTKNLCAQIPMVLSRFMRKNVLQDPTDLRSAGNEGVARSRLQVLSGKALPL